MMRKEKEPQMLQEKEMPYRREQVLIRAIHDVHFSTGMLLLLLLLLKVVAGTLSATLVLLLLLLLLLLLRLLSFAVLTFLAHRGHFLLIRDEKVMGKKGGVDKFHYIFSKVSGQHVFQTNLSR